MASLRKKKSHYYARFYDKRRTPKRKEIALGCTRKDVARRRLVEWERLYDEGEFDPWADRSGPERLSVVDAVARFLNDRSHLRPRTLDTYCQQLERWHEQHTPAGLLVASVSAEHLRPYSPRRKHHERLTAQALPPCAGLPELVGRARTHPEHAAG